MISVGVNLIVMIATGWANKDTAIFKSFDHFSDGWKYKKFLEFGIGLQMLFAGMVKYEAPELKIDVNPMNWS